MNQNCQEARASFGETLASNPHYSPIMAACESLYICMRLKLGAEPMGLLLVTVGLNEWLLETADLVARGTRRSQHPWPIPSLDRWPGR
jgi:hypothetical protein